MSLGLIKFCFTKNVLLSLKMLFYDLMIWKLLSYQAKKDPGRHHISPHEGTCGLTSSDFNSQSGISSDSPHSGGSTHPSEEYCPSHMSNSSEGWNLTTYTQTETGTYISNKEKKA